MNRGATWCAWAVLTVSALLAGGCVTTEGAAQEAEAVVSDGAVPLPPIRPERAADGGGNGTIVPSGDFDAWKGGFRQRALAAGITGEVFDAAFAGVTVNARVLELDRYQPEFVRPLWDYVDSAVSQKRLRNGKAKLRQYRALLDALPPG